MLAVSILENLNFLVQVLFRRMVYKREAIEYTPHVPKTCRSQCVPKTRMSMTRRVKVGVIFLEGLTFRLEEYVRSV